MVKFWTSDFEYIKRFGNVRPFNYKFKVRGESANYLMNKYRLVGNKVFVGCSSDETIYIGSCVDDGTSYGWKHCNDDDIDELYGILEPIMNMDMRNYEEYIADDWYKKDDRWE